LGCYELKIRSKRGRKLEQEVGNALFQTCMRR